MAETVVLVCGGDSSVAPVALARLAPGLERISDREDLRTVLSGLRRGLAEAGVDGDWRDCKAGTVMAEGRQFAVVEMPWLRSADLEAFGSSGGVLVGAVSTLPPVPEGVGKRQWAVGGAISHKGFAKWAGLVDAASSMAAGRLSGEDPGALLDPEKPPVLIVSRHDGAGPGADVSVHRLSDLLAAAGEDVGGAVDRDGVGRLGSKAGGMVFALARSEGFAPGRLATMEEGGRLFVWVSLRGDGSACHALSGAGVSGLPGGRMDDATAKGAALEAVREVSSLLSGGPGGSLTGSLSAGDLSGLLGTAPVVSQERSSEPKPSF